MPLHGRTQPRPARYAVIILDRTQKGPGPSYVAFFERGALLARRTRILPSVMTENAAWAVVPNENRAMVAEMTTRCALFGSLSQSLAYSLRAQLSRRDIRDGLHGSPPDIRPDSSARLHAGAH